MAYSFPARQSPSEQITNQMNQKDNLPRSEFFASLTPGTDISNLDDFLDAEEPAVTNHRDAVTFWKKQCEKTIARNMELYGELDAAENTIASLWFSNVIFGALFLVALGYILL